MKKVLLISFLTFLNSFSQTYVGRIPLENQTYYTRITISDKDAKISLPRFIGLHESKLKKIENTNYKFVMGLNNYSIKVQSKKSKTMIVEFQSIRYTFYQLEKEQRSSENTNLAGEFKSDDGRLLQITLDNQRLQTLSPLSSEFLIIRKINDNRYWSENGHLYQFIDNNSVEILTDNERVLFKRFKAYTVEDVWIKSNQNEIYGKLYRSLKSEKTPACLLLQGGGSAGLANYELEAKYFAMNGISVLLCDKAGDGKSKGPVSFRQQTFDEKVEEYWDLFSYLREMDFVDKQKVGVHGLSEGGRLAVMMGIEPKQPIAFIISGAGPITTREEQQLFAIANHHRDLGASESKTTEANALWLTYFNAVKAGKITQEFVDKVRSFDSKGLRMLIPPASRQALSARMKKDLENRRVIDELGKLKTPILLQYGENDMRVDRPLSIRRFEANRSKDLTYNIITYPRASHSFMTPEWEISKNYTQDKIHWLKFLKIL